MLGSFVGGMEGAGEGCHEGHVVGELVGLEDAEDALLASRAGVGSRVGNVEDMVGLAVVGTDEGLWVSIRIEMIPTGHCTTTLLSEAFVSRVVLAQSYRNSSVLLAKSAAI